MMCPTLANVVADSPNHGRPLRGTLSLERRRSARARVRILVLNSEIPFPPITGAQSRTYYLVWGLAAEHEVTLVGFSWDSHDPPFVRSLPLEIISVPWRPSDSYRKMHDASSSVSLAAYRHLAYESAEPWFVSYYSSAAMESSLAALRSRSFDLILIEHSFMARFLPFLRADVPKVLDLHNVHTLMAWRRAQEKSDSQEHDFIKEFERTRSFERAVCRACQLCLCCSDQDAQAARRFLETEHVSVIPNGVDTSLMTPGTTPVEPGYLLFTGMLNYEPNREAARYFVREILPLIHAECPGATFHIAGANPSPEVAALADGSVFVHASVPDMRPYFHRASVVVVPLLHGGGTRLKILDAAACGKPVVSTSVGAEGLNFVEGRDLLLANSAPEFAETVIKLLREPERQTQLSRYARRAAEVYDWCNIASEFCRVMIGVAEGRPRVSDSLHSQETRANAHREDRYGR